MTQQTTPTTTQNEIVTFAMSQGIGLELVYTLPAIFDKVAQIAGQPVRAIISQATYTNQPLADYIKELAIEVAGKVEAN